MKNYFLPLGGADEVGASSYFVNVDGVRMILMLEQGFTGWKFIQIIRCFCSM